jgi:hypothetical protein
VTQAVGPDRLGQLVKLLVGERREHGSGGVELQGGTPCAVGVPTAPCRCCAGGGVGRGARAFNGLGNPRFG